MISYKEAVAIVREVGVQKGPAGETVGVEDIVGRICAQRIVTPIANQPFDNSAMDGFALRAEDLSHAAHDNPVALEMIGHIAAGDPSGFQPPARNQCYEIMTGAPLPPGCDCVVPVEKTKKMPGNKILFAAPPRQGDNIRRAGEDFGAGDTVLQKGTVLNAGHILTLATLGIGKVGVLKRTRVALVSTGREVVDRLGAELAPGQIYNSTRPYLSAALKGAGADVDNGATVPDDPKMFRENLLRLIEEGADICISTGAVSAGVHDFIPAMLKDMGAEVLFHKVAIKPGKPILFARFPQGPLFMGLPGNPVSSAAGLRFFIQPLLRAMGSLPPEEPQYAALKHDFPTGKGGLRLFLRARLFDYAGKSAPEVEIPSGQLSFKVRPFVDTNAWAVIPEDAEFLKAGEIIELRQ